MDKDVLEIAKKTLKSAINFDIDQYSEIKAGNNNKLFRLDSNKGYQLLLKIYYEDDRLRLQREFDAFYFLNQKKFLHIPKAFVKNDEYHFAAYSFEQGNSKSNKAISSSDIRIMAKFIAKLHKIRKEQIQVIFRPAVFACFSLQNYIDNIHFRSQKYFDYIATGNAHQKIQAFHKQQDIEQSIKLLIKDAIGNLTEEELRQTLPDNQQGLSPVDFGPHNMIFKEDGEIVFIDFEYFGWDDPAREIGDFVNHDQTKDIPKDLKKLFIKSYIQQISASGAFIRRLQIVIKLIAIEWLSIHLYAMTPEKMSARRFADNNFSDDSYLDEQIAKFQERMNNLLT